MNIYSLRQVITRVVFFSLFFLTSCGEGPQRPTNTQKTNEPIISPTSSLISKTETPTLEPESTPINFPTYEQIDQDVLKNWLYEKITQPECNLPCFWGITPGETTVIEAYQILAPYASETNSQVIGSKFLFYYFISPSSYDDPVLYLEYSGDKMNDKVNNLFFSDLSTYSSYSVQSILVEYGPPDDIWIKAWSPDPDYDDTPRGTSFILYYPSQQFMIQYWQSPDNGEISGNSVISCFDNGPSITSWSKKFIEEESENIIKNHLLGKVRPYLRLEDVTGMSPEEFFETFVNTTGDVCVETPLDIWLSSKSGEFD